MDQRATAIRQGFLDYFAKHGHAVVKSSSLLPANDPTLMFTNAGMVQFKDVFVGAEKRPYKRATSCQKCLRVSGKHNDLEEVGRTARHHTFFEMLGNFSFGDYFKPEAIELAWNLISREWGLDQRRLWVTVFGGEAGVAADYEARALWKKVSGLPESRILDMGMKDNFWAMGDTGPCGPCTEIHYDLVGTGEVTLDDFSNGRLVEIWNNVFMQFERFQDGTMVPLQKTGVDTGMGLERITAIIQGQRSNYDSDLFMPLIDTVAAAVGKPYGRSENDDDVSMRVIADHARTTAMLTADGAQPANEGRGYVMRRIMRRAIRHGQRLGFSDVFFAGVCDVVVEIMGDAYPELRESRSLIGKVADLEERSFRRTLETGLRILEEQIKTAAGAGGKTLPGATIFKLYDTYGFPKDLTEVIAAERGFALDDAGFDAEMAAQQARSRGADVGEAAVDTVYKELAQTVGEIEFIGYPHEDVQLSERAGTWRHRQDSQGDYLEAACEVKALVLAGRRVEAIDADAAGGASVEIVLSPTPFYGESGGQVGDAGTLASDRGFFAEVLDTKKPVIGLTISRLQARSGVVRLGDRVWAGYTPEVRKATRAHHSATHILHAALRKILGGHVKQAGSSVSPHHLRFDYAHFEAPSPMQLAAIEDEANARVQRRDVITTEVLPFTEAKQRGALAFFGDKYGDVVRMVAMGESIELCGGTHAANTGDIGLIVITREEAVASGVRRLEAMVGEAARRYARETAARLAVVGDMLTSCCACAGGDNNVVSSAVVKALKQREELSQALLARGVTMEASTVPAIHAFGVGSDPSANEARLARDLWQALVLLANSRAADADEISAKHAAYDTGVVAAFAGLLAANREAEKRLDQARRSQRSESAGDLISNVRDIHGIKVLTARCDGSDARALRELADALRPRLGSGVLALGSELDGKVALLVAVTADLTSRFHAGKLIGQLAPLIGGKGGGKPDLAQAGGGNPAGLEQAFAALDMAVAAS